MKEMAVRMLARCSMMWLFLFVGFSWTGWTAESLNEADQETKDLLLNRCRVDMSRAAKFWAEEVASHGGYVWEISSDLVTRRRGESKDLSPSTVWVQDGTPWVGDAFLRAFEVTGDDWYLAAALEAGKCLAWGQLESGGWGYSIEFDLSKNRYRYHHLEDLRAMDNITTFDDDNTQSATRFLMRLDRWVDEETIDAAIQRALNCFLKAQYSGGLWDGAWPQRYPPPSGYGAFPTFNDSTMNDCVRTLLQAYRQYGKQEYRDSLERCLEFYLRSQGPEDQAGWAQQYDEELRPAWARRFEPPSISGSESCANCNLLLDMYIEWGDQRLLDAVGRTVRWYERSRINGTKEAGIWARFYELESNRPLYFTKTYELVYTDEDLPIHYSFRGNYGVNAMMSRYAEILEKGRERLVAESLDPLGEDAWRKKTEALSGKTRAVLDALDEKGRWIKRVPRTEQTRDEQGRVVLVKDEENVLDMMYTRDFVHNLRWLADYVEAAQAGPKRRYVP